MKAYPMISGEPEKYKSHIILIGTFQCFGVYLKGVGNIYCLGSGWTEMALETKLITKDQCLGSSKGRIGIGL